MNCPCSWLVDSPLPVPLWVNCPQLHCLNWSLYTYPIGWTSFVGLVFFPQISWTASNTHNQADWPLSLPQSGKVARTPIRSSLLAWLECAIRSTSTHQVNCHPFPLDELSNLSRSVEFPLPQLGELTTPISVELATLPLTGWSVPYSHSFELSHPHIIICSLPTICSYDGYTDNKIPVEWYFVGNNMLLKQ